MEKILIRKSSNLIHFYLIFGGESRYLFSQKFTAGVFKYFENGRTMAELRRFHQWERNPRLDKTIEKIPMYIRYVRKEAA